MFKVSVASLSPAVNESVFLQVGNELPDLSGHLLSISMILLRSSSLPMRARSEEGVVTPHRRESVTSSGMDSPR
jgi:hypothetical protein